MMRRKINVCCYCEAWGLGGIETFWMNVIGQLDRTVYKIDIVTAKKLSGFYDRQLDGFGIRLIKLGGNIKNYAGNYHSLKKLFQHKKYDVVHINAYQAVTLVYAQCAVICGIRNVIVHSHSAAVKKGRGYLPKFAAHTFAKYFFANEPVICLACSEQAGEFMYPKWKNVSIVPNGICTEKFRFSEEKREMVRRRLGLGDKFVVGMVGRLCMEKNQAYGIEVFAELKKRWPDAVLLIVGEGDLEHDLKKIVAEKQLQSSVIFYGASRKVNVLLQGMDVLLMPSKVEGFGLAAVEAQAGGLPVVCSDKIPREAIVNKNIAVRLPLDKSPGEWANKMSDTVREPNKRKRNNFSGTKFDIRVTVNMIEGIWKRE